MTPDIIAQREMVARLDEAEAEAQAVYDAASCALEEVEDVMKRKTYEQKREYVLAYGLAPGLRARYRDDPGQPAVAVTVMAVTHRMQVVIRFDEPAHGRSEGAEKRVEPFRLRPGHPDRWLVQHEHSNGTLVWLESEDALSGGVQWNHCRGVAKRFRRVDEAVAASNRASMRGRPASIVRVEAYDRVHTLGEPGSLNDVRRERFRAEASERMAQAAMAVVCELDLARGGER